jgi:hypothetical protein
MARDGHPASEKEGEQKLSHGSDRWA